MEIIRKKLADLVPYENNPRDNRESISMVTASIKEFGFLVPIVIDKDNVIVAGHTRYCSAKKLKLKEVPCVVADELNEEQIKGFRLADNKAGESSSWITEMLNDELDDIVNIDMTDFGFDFDVLEDEPEEVEEDLFEDIEKLDTRYGVPYQGNKPRIADRIISALPGGKRLVDLFGGGGAITHCALLSGKWESQLYNDINPMITGLFMDAINGKYHDEKRVITRDDFNALKDTDAYVKYIWSFGNNGNGYLWGADIEEVKCQACRIVVSETIEQRRTEYMAFIKCLENSRFANAKKLSNAKELHSLEALQGLQQLEALQRLEVTNIDYRDYKYIDSDVVYMDVPYEQTEKKKTSCDDYGVNFNSKEFYSWVKEQDYQIYFSSYKISDKDFYKIKIKTVQSLIGPNTNGKKVNEYLYSNRPIEGFEEGQCQIKDELKTY